MPEITTNSDASKEQTKRTDVVEEECDIRSVSLNASLQICDG